VERKTQSLQEDLDSAMEPEMEPELLILSEVWRDDDRRW
jgi:hypothetical protein